MLVLRDEYESAPGFVKRIDWLISQGWIGIRYVLLVVVFIIDSKSLRRAKGDGDCFYRGAPAYSIVFLATIDFALFEAFAFAWVERVLRAADQELAVAAAVSTLHTTYLGLADVGFDAMVVSNPLIY